MSLLNHAIRYSTTSQLRIWYPDQDCCHYPAGSDTLTTDISMHVLDKHLASVICDIIRIQEILLGLDLLHAQHQQGALVCKQPRFEVEGKG